MSPTTLSPSTATAPTASKSSRKLRQSFRDMVTARSDCFRWARVTNICSSPSFVERQAGRPRTTERTSRSNPESAHAGNIQRRHRARGTPARVLLPETAVTKPTATQRLSTQGGVSVSGNVLVPLLHRVRLNGSEWRIVVAVLISSRPVSARELALGLRLDYGFVKRIVRGLVAWRILSATPEGLSVQPDATRWAAAPAGGRQR